MANPSLDALAAALEQTKWKLPPSLGELAAQLSRMLTAVRRAVQARRPITPGRQKRCAAVRHRCAGRPVRWTRPTMRAPRSTGQSPWPSRPTHRTLRGSPRSPKRCA